MSESTDFSAIETRGLLSYESKEREKKKKRTKVQSRPITKVEKRRINNCINKS